MQENETEATASTEQETGSETTDTTTAADETTGENIPNQTESGAQNSSPETIDAVEDGAATVEANDNSAETETVESVPEDPVEPEEEEEITYHAVQKEDSVTAIWEMQGRKHIRTIDPRSREGAEILRLFTAEEGEEMAA